MKKIIITGATGFIGRHILDILKSKEEYEVHPLGLNRFSLTNREFFWHRVDLLDDKQVDKLIDEVQPDLLMHLAWYAVPGKYWNSESNLRWEEASISLIRKFYERGGRRVIGAGTCAEYAYSANLLLEKSSLLAPLTLYGRCKLSVEHFLSRYSKEFNVSSAWGRIFFLYGPYENPNRLIPFVIRSLLKGKKAPCTHGRQVRDFLYVKDVASAFVALLESEIEGPVNISSSSPLTIQEIVFAAADRLGMRHNVQFGRLPAQENEPPFIVGDNHRLTEEVKWFPMYDLIAGMMETVEYWKEKRGK